MSAVAEALVRELRSRFSGHGLSIEQGPPKYLRFAAIHPEVGDVLIYDDGDEFTVVYGNFTHCHYGPFDASSGKGSTEAIAAVIEQLDALFSDRLVMWGSHSSSGGIITADEENALWQPGDARYVWSGPIAEPSNSSSSGREEA